MDKDIDFSGGKELDAALKQFPMKVQKNILRGAIRAGSRTIVKKAKQLAPRDDGKLRKSIRAKSPKLKGKLITGGLSAGNKDAYYAEWVEFGTKKYTIKNYFPKRLARSLKRKGVTITQKDYKRALTIDGGLFHKADHPGITPQPFMRTAMDSSHQEALNAFADYMRDRIPKEIQKNGR